MVITKEQLKAEIDRVPERYLEVIYRFVQNLVNPFDFFTPETADEPTLEQVIANIQNLPKPEANIERATASLAEGLRNSPYVSDPAFDVAQWNAQWDALEAQMKQDELSHEQKERYLL